MGKTNDKEVKRDELGTGFSHGYEPVEAIDLSKINDADELLKGMSKTSFGGRKLGEAADAFYEMITDPDCYVVMTLSGAMTVAKMGLVICDMIDRGMVNAIVSTGALITHGLVENAGKSHFKYDFGTPDAQLHNQGYDRVYDTLELEKNLDDVGDIVDDVLESCDPKEVLCSRTLCNKIGEYLVDNRPGRGILKSAHEKSVPIYIPAFTDCELGIDLGVYNYGLKKAGQPELKLDPYLDMNHFTGVIFNSKTTGIFTIGGGVPRNWAQQVGPYLDFIRFRHIEDGKYFAEKNSPYMKPYKYAIRICPEPVTWGGLSGCTYSEGVSWGKFYDPKEGGRFAEVPSEATLVWPLLMKGVMERLDKNKVTIKKNFDNEEKIRSVAF